MKRLIVFSALCIGLGATAWAAECKIWLQGNSTLHAYSSTATQVQVQLEPAGLDAAALLGGKAAALQVTVSVQELKSGSDKLDKNMRSALKAKEHPAILFRLARYEAAKSQGAGASVKAYGKLKIAGVEREVELTAQGSATERGLRLSGRKEILMTDYGIKPPTVLGMIKTDNLVVVHFDLSLP